MFTSLSSMNLLDVIVWVFIHGELKLKEIFVLCRCSKAYKNFIYEERTFWKEIAIRNVCENPRNKYIEIACIYDEKLNHFITYPNLTHIYTSWRFMNVMNFDAPNLHTINMRFIFAYSEILGLNDILHKKEGIKIRDFCARFPKLVNFEIVTITYRYAPILTKVLKEYIGHLNIRNMNKAQG